MEDKDKTDSRKAKISAIQSQFDHLNSDDSLSELTEAEKEVLREFNNKMSADVVNFLEDYGDVIQEALGDSSKEAD